MSNIRTNAESVSPLRSACLRASRIMPGGSEIPAPLARLCGGILGWAISKMAASYYTLIMFEKKKIGGFPTFF
jgi:hypothetical protein